MSIPWGTIVLLAALGADGTATTAAEGLLILPQSIVLTGSLSEQRLVVERLQDGQAVGPVADEAITWEIEDPTLAAVVGKVLRPLADGETTLRARVGDQEATTRIRIERTGEPLGWDFRHHVQAVLTKAGCNSGACHGALAGKKGFRLSLRGYDPHGDYHAIVEEALGRRVNLVDPGRSLLLTKPTTALPHGGGKRIELGSREYRVLAEWIAHGAPPPPPPSSQATDSMAPTQVTAIEVAPAAIRTEPGVRQPLLVTARYSDGHTEDVTAWAKYTAADGSVAQVSDDGLVEVVGHGESAITVWYMNQIVVSTITAPHPGEDFRTVIENAPRRNFIDDLVLEKLRLLNIPPSPRSTDEEFVRRAFLDTIGVLPTVEETSTFLADQRTEKRDELIDALLTRPEFVDYWTYKWSDLLLVNSERLPGPAMWSYSRWIRDHVEADTPWDTFVRELLTIQGHTLEVGGANFFVLHQDTRELSENISQAFLGMSINCARCHNHPLEKWTNEQYFGMANLLARVHLKDERGGFVVFSASEGELLRPLTGKPVPPQPLDGPAYPLDSPIDRRQILADWVTAPENPYFARAITNRVWANFMGVGLVEAVDDLRVSNPASNEQLLTALADHLVRERFQLKALMREILRSETYQRSSVPVQGNESDHRFYSRYYPRRLMAEVLVDAIASVTGVPTAFPGYPETWRAMQLPDSKVANLFLDKFGRPERDQTCECERTRDPSMVQVLHLANGDTVHQKLTRQGNRLDDWLASGKSPAELLDSICLTALSRPARPQEREAVTEMTRELPPEEWRSALEDIVWGILSSKEFLFNH